ncbi:alpha/beta fold hydrolase [Spirillospora sp. NPDC048911]|uniref:alpha/beta fold hydrolase n=1 Tax=Spirillospora sp. NPDC048911 TaxID=3364527 RepID=UPI00371C28D9
MLERTLTQQALADLAAIPAQSRWTTSNGLRLHALDYGGPRTPLVIIPGITSPAIAMDFVARELTDLVRPIVLDVRGRGFSDDGPSYTLQDYAADTQAQLADLKAPILLGHSMGARIAALVATRSTLRGTILVDPPMSGPGRGTYPTTLAAFQTQLAQAQQGTTADEVAKSWPRWPRREQELRARWLSSCGADAVTATHQGFETEDFFDTWPAVPAPTALIYGADSPVVTSTGAEEAARTNPAAALTEIPDAGHMVFWDNPAAALKTTREILRTLV